MIPIMGPGIPTPEPYDMYPMVRQCLPCLVETIESVCFVCGEPTTPLPIGKARL